MQKVEPPKRFYFCMPWIIHLDQFIFPTAQADLLPVFQGSLPLGVGVGGQEVVVGVVTAMR